VGVETERGKLSRVSLGCQHFPREGIPKLLGGSEGEVKEDTGCEVESPLKKAFANEGG